MRAASQVEGRATAGLGVQDAGYAVLSGSMGLPPHTTAAFVRFKRAKELAWIALGIRSPGSDAASDDRYGLS